MLSNNHNMLLQNGISTERVALILQRYERRLENNKKWAKDYYNRHADDIEQKKLIAGVAKGRCPSSHTIERLEVDRMLLRDAWMAYTTAQNELPDRARVFHRYRRSGHQIKSVAFETLKRKSRP